ncbi:MAG: hypothetical protein QME81_17390, partial [bacterium]|nr:hypothetical protein [bacterium]
IVYLLYSFCNTVSLNAYNFIKRMVSSNRFPFAIYYRIDNNMVLVYAVLDCRRNPAWIKDRLTERLTTNY